MQQITNFFYQAKGDLFYGFLLLFSSILAFLLRHFGSFGTRRKLDGFLGFGITFFVAGRMLFCSLIVVVVHLVMFRCIKNPRFLTNLSFYGTFVFLAILRLMHFIGLPRLEFVTNAIQLILTLRVIGLSYEIADFRLSKKSDNKKIEHFIEKEPSTFEAFNYFYNFTGLFTGPYFTYRTYSDALTKWKRPLLWSKLKPLLIGKMKTLSWSLPSLIFLTWLDPVNVLRGERTASLLGLFYDFVWCALAFLYLRMRIYSAWMVAESICLLTGIGLYPKEGKSTPGNGPTEMQKIMDIDWNDVSIEFDSETINNLDIPNVEHSDGFRSGMRAWNRTVQFWLANFVYRRSDRSIRMFYTMLVSSFWHGIHPGYFLSFLTIPLCTAAEDKLFNTFTIENRPKLLQISWSFIRTRGFEFMAAGFLLLDGWDTLRLWGRMYFWLHFAMLFVIVATYLLKSDPNTKQKDQRTKFPSNDEQKMN
uniref:Lysophospholipid acyltransferase 7 n=1 Tax=Meloidogyne enterolobii TaxID=390850 RepID=A0A6V7W2G7_MELEN|nr:unnamed protein product [Meloidogyne enterolobii]